MTDYSHSLDLWRPDWEQARPVFGALLVLIVLDFALGFLGAWLAQMVSSTVSFKGMAKKAAMILFVVTAVVLDPFVDGIPVAKLIALFFLVTEVVSIMENMKRLGVPLPDWLGGVLVKLKSPAVAASSDPQGEKA